MSAWKKIYSRINWKNQPSRETPINATNMNKMDEAIDILDNRIVELNSNLIPINGQYAGIMSINRYSSKYYCIVPMSDYILKTHDITCDNINVGGILQTQNVTIDRSINGIAIACDDTINEDITGCFAIANLTFIPK